MSNSNMEIYKISTYYPDEDGDYYGYQVGRRGVLHIAISDQQGNIVQQGSPGYYRVLFSDKEMVVVSARDFEGIWRST